MLDNPKYIHDDIVYSSESQFHHLKNNNFLKINHLFRGHEIIFATSLTCNEHTAILISKHKEIYNFYQFDWCYYCERVFDNKNNFKLHESKELEDIIEFMIQRPHGCYDHKNCSYIRGIYEISNSINKPMDCQVFYLPLTTIEEIYNNRSDSDKEYSYEGFLYSALENEFDNYLKICRQNNLDTIKMVEMDYFCANCVLFFGAKEEIEKSKASCNGRYEIRPNMRELTVFPKNYNLDRSEEYELRGY